MPVLSEMKKSAGLRWSHHRKGFASGYFLAILLYCTMIFTVIGTNDINRLKTMINIQEIQKKQKIEITALNEVKCRLRNHEKGTGLSYTAWGSYEIDDSGTYACLNLLEYSETILLYADSETGKITDWKIV